MYNYYQYYPKAAARPKAAAGKHRKKFGETWWGKQWVENLSKYENDQRMARGRAYARADKVKEFKITKGKITAKVKGSLGIYNVKIIFKKHSDEDWDKIISKIRDAPLVIGQLLNNEIPPDIETITGFKFVPESFSSDCSCPDYANPCKHIAAVFYTTAEEIDYNPSRLFLLHGLEREELLDRLDMSDAPKKKTKKPAKKSGKKRKKTKTPKAKSK